MSQPSEYICVLRPSRKDMLRTGRTEREAEVIGRHFEYLSDLCRRGVVVLAGRTLTDDEQAFGICVFRAASRDAAEAMAQADPAIAEHVMTGTVLPFRIALLGARPPDASDAVVD